MNTSIKVVAVTTTWEIIVPGAETGQWVATCYEKMMAEYGDDVTCTVTLTATDAEATI